MSRVVIVVVTLYIRRSTWRTSFILKVSVRVRVLVVVLISTRFKFLIGLIGLLVFEILLLLVVVAIWLKMGVKVIWSLLMLIRLLLLLLLVINSRRLDEAIWLKS